MIRDRERHRAMGFGRRFRGFTLIELMVAMLLGLIVIGGVTSVFLAGQQTYRANEALGDVGDSSRTAFEMLARDIRSAGLSGCDNSSGRVSNTLNPSTTNWWADWNNALHGYDNAGAIDDPALTAALPSSGPTSPVPNQSSLHIISTDALGLTVNTDTEPGASIHLNEATSNLGVGDVIMICDLDHAAIAQISGPSATSITVIVHNTGAKVSPGNCTKGLGYPTSCSSTNGNIYTFGHNARVAKLTASDWYIGNNPVGGFSLYRLSLVNSGSGPVPTPQEMVRNVIGMKITYLQPPGTSFVTASKVTGTSSLGPPPTGWAAVNAAQITLTVQSANLRASVNNAAPIQRSFTSISTVRNRVQ